MAQLLDRDNLENGVFMDHSPLHRCRIDSPLGELVAVATDKTLVMLEFNNRARFDAQEATVRRYCDGPMTEGTNPVLDQTSAELASYFNGELKAFTVPLQFLGTPFQNSVWNYLVNIGYGQTATYSQIAQFLGKKEASRAVGKANGDNRLAIIVPCHRVLRADGDLCGYAGGLGRKQFLLALESGQPTLL